MSLDNTNIDINSDLGEIDPSFKLEGMIMPLIDRCNIAAGAHAGNNESIKQTLILAAENKVKVGIHPSYPDRENFGRIRLNIADAKLMDSIKNQLINFAEIADKNNIGIDHIKAHGALYHCLGEEESIAEKYLTLIQDLFPNKNILVSPNSKIERLSSGFSMGVLNEAFGDRKYTIDGKLQYRKIEGSILSDPSVVIEQIEHIINDKGLTIEDSFIPLKVNTICVHSDTENAVKILQAIKNHFA